MLPADTVLPSLIAIALGATGDHSDNYNSSSSSCNINSHSGNSSSIDKTIREPEKPLVGRIVEVMSGP